MKPEQCYRKLEQIRISAKRRGLDFNLSLRDVNNISSQKYCAYSGEKFQNKKAQHDDKLTYERVDNNKGYVRGNVVPVKMKYNTMRADHSLDDLKAICRDPYLGKPTYDIRTSVDIMLDSLTPRYKGRFDKYVEIHAKSQKNIGLYHNRIIRITNSIERIMKAGFIDKLKLKYGIPLESTKKELVKEIYERIRSSL